MGISHVATPRGHGRMATSRAAIADAPLLRSGLVDRSARVLERNASIGEALDLLIGARLWGVPVTDRGTYLGTVTAASLIALSLPVTPDSLAPGAGLAWLQTDIPRLRQRLEGAGSLPLEQALDIAVPTIRASSSPAHLLLLLARRGPLVAVLDDDGARLLGVATSETAIGVLRSAA